MISLAMSLAMALAAGTPSLDEERARALSSSSALESLAALLRVEDRLSRDGDTASRRVFRDEVIEDAASPLARAHARFSRMLERARQGAFTEARADRDALGVVAKARLGAPLENPGGVLLLHPTPLDEDPTAATRGHVIDVDPRDARFDIGSQFVELTDLRTTLSFAVVAERDTDIALRVANAGQVAVRVNGALLAVFEGDRPLTFDQTAVVARIPKGPSLVVLTLGALARPLEARVRITAPSGDPIAGIATTVDAAVMTAAARAAPLSTTTTAAADWRADIARFTAHPPLVRLPDDGSDPLVDAIVVERALRAEDARQAPKAHEVWLFALRTRVRLARDAGGRAPPLADILVDIAESAGSRDPSAARQALDEALALDEGHTRARAALAMLRDEQGFTRDARAQFERLAADPSVDGETLARALRFLRTFGHDRPRVDGRIVELAVKGAHPALIELALDVRIERGDLAGALALADLARARDEADPTAQSVALDLTGALLASDDEEERARGIEEARALLELRVQHHPSNHRDFRRLVLVEHAAGAEVAVARMLDERAAAFPLRPDVPALRAELALLQGDRATARARLLDALALAPQDADLARTFSILDDEGAALPADLTLDIAHARSMEPPAGAAEVGAFVASRTVYVRVFSNGLASIVEDSVVRVLDAAKSDALLGHEVPWVPGRERLSVLVAARHLVDGRQELPASVDEMAPDGKVNGVYTDQQTRVIAFRRLADGDVLHVRTRVDLVGRQNLFGDFFGRVEPIQSDLPVSRFVMRVTLPSSRNLSWGGRGAPAPVVTEGDGDRTFTFTREDVPRVRMEPGMPPFLEVADFVSVSTYARWEELGAWYAALVKDALFVDDELRSIARQVVAGATTDEERVRRIYEYVVSSTRYLGIELGIHGWKPYPVTLVHRRRYGDCKDKASLLFVLLEEIGIEARLALVRTSDIGVIDGEPASMWLFNHAIAYVPSLDLFLDGTAERSGYRELPAMDQGAMTLLVDPKGREVARLGRIPESSADANLNQSAYLMDVETDGTVRIDIGEERFRGVRAAEERATFEDVGTRKDRLASSLAEVLPGIALEALEFTDLSLANPEVGYRLRAVLPGRATVDEDGALRLPISLYPHDLARAYASRTERTQPVWLDARWKTKNVMRYRLPKDHVVVDLPTSSIVSAPGFRFEQKITAMPDGFVVEEITSFSERRISVDDYATLRAALAEADAKMRTRVRIVRAGSAS